MCKKPKYSADICHRNGDVSEWILESGVDNKTEKRRQINYGAQLCFVKEHVRLKWFAGAADKCVFMEVQSDIYGLVSRKKLDLRKVMTRSEFQNIQQELIGR